MDYLETILRRQWKLWGALPRGGAPDASAEERGIRGAESMEEALFREAATGLPAEERLSGNERLETAENPERDRFRMQEALLRRSAQLRRALLAEGGETLPESGSVRLAENRRDGGRDKQSTERLSPGESGGLELPGTGNRTEAEPDAPRTVSRQFEQDARRYDGGFFLY
ncbi:MAG: hypothetical protein RR092_07060 [Oscillospiraceae bacterium]